MEPIDRLFHILRQAGPGHYGESAVTQYEHAVQCAMLAEREGATPALVTAALLHDIGHLTNADDRAAAARGDDARHERIGAALLARWFGETVAAPVRLHVPAKRYLTACEPGYFSALSSGSRRSLALQGGPFTPREAGDFIVLPHAEAAVRLRRWDDAAKVAGAPVADLEHFVPYLADCVGSAVAKTTNPNGGME
jgi:phosphonate degradation associated HDIG domain protein